MSIIAVMFLIIGILSLGYLILIISYSGIGTAFLWFWLLLGIGSIIFSGVLRYLYTNHIQVNKYVRLGFFLVLILGLGVFLMVEGTIINYGKKEPEPGADYVIVLGAQVRGKALSRALKNRLDTAYTYLAENETAKVIVSGGRGTGEDISEAEAMSIYLLSKGIEEERIIKEDQSTNTFENIRNSKDFIGNKTSHIVIVTNNFHVYRAVHIAMKLEITQVQGLGAPSDDIMKISYYVREFLAVLKDKLVGNI
jgi:uncharacterized SAM-binding protein YcdF (DUF218 family)